MQDLPKVRTPHLSHNSAAVAAASPAESISGSAAGAEKAVGASLWSLELTSGSRASVVQRRERQGECRGRRADVAENIGLAAGSSQHESTHAAH